MRRNSLTTHKEGFTLIELLVVIAVIGMLASIVLVSLGPVRQRGRDAAAQSDLRQMVSAFELKYDDNDAYPNIPDTMTDIPASDTTLAPYLSPTPRTSGGNIYQWTDGGDTQTFCVVVDLEQGDFFYASNDGVGETTSAACP